MRSQGQCSKSTATRIESGSVHARDIVEFFIFVSRGHRPSRRNSLNLPDSDGHHLFSFDCLAVCFGWIMLPFQIVERGFNSEAILFGGLTVGRIDRFAKVSVDTTEWLWNL